MITKYWVHIKKVSATNSDGKRRYWSAVTKVTFFFSLRQNKTNILENKNDFSNEQHRFSSCQGVWTFPNQRLMPPYRTPRKPHETEQTSPTLLHTASTLMQWFCWDADAWNETAWICHLCISILFSSAQRQRWWVTLCLPSGPLHAMLLNEMCFSGLHTSVLAVWISPLEEWQSRLFAPLNTFPSLQLCLGSGHPSSGNWTAPAAQFFSPLCSHSQ